MLFDKLARRWNPLGVMSAVPVRDLQFKELLYGESVFVLEEVTDFLKALNRLIRTALHDVVDYVYNVLVEITQLLLGLSFLEDFLQFLVLLDGLTRERVEELLALLAHVDCFYHSLI
jgi:hypothetical protein